MVPRVVEGHIVDFDRPKVSVVIPTYNRPDATHRAVQSLLDQDSSMIHEIIVVDDGSDDNARVPQTIEGDSVRIVRHDSNRGAAWARNTGIEEATGDWIALLDSDDVWLPGKLDRQFEFMRRLGLNVSCTAVIRQSAVRSEKIVRPYPEVLGLRQLVWGCHISPGTTMVAERALLERLGGYDATLGRLEDWDLLLRMAAQDVQIGYLPVPLAVIERSRRPDKQVVQRSIDAIGSKHQSFFESRGHRWARHFTAALRFERGIALWHSGRHVRAMFDIGVSWVSAPVANLPARLQVSAILRRVSSPSETN